MGRKLGAAAAAGAIGVSAVVGAALLSPGFASAVDTASTPTATSSASPTATTPAQRTADRTAAIKERLAGLVKDGTITQAQADKVASTLAADAGPLGGGPGGHGGRGPGFGFGLGPAGDGLAAAATALGVTEDSLRTSLRSGKSLATVAGERKVPVATLVQAIVTAEKKAIADAVTAKRITQAQADKLLADLTQRVTDRVNATRPEHAGGFGGRGFGPGRGAPSATPTA